MYFFSKKSYQLFIKDKLILSIWTGTLFIFIISLIQMRNGTFMSPISWGVFEPAVSLLINGRYELLNGKIGNLPYPPGASVYLMFFCFLFHSTGWSVILSFAVIRAFSFCSWSVLFYYILKRSPLEEIKIGFVFRLINILLAALLLSKANELEANYLQLIILPLIFYYSMVLFETKSFKNFVIVLIKITGCFFIQFYIHYSAVIFVPGLFIVILLNSAFKIRYRIFSAFLFLGMNTFLAVIILKKYMMVKTVADFNMVSVILKNPIKIFAFLGNGKYDALTLLKQASNGFSNFFLPSSASQILVHGVSLVFTFVVIIILLNFFKRVLRSQAIQELTIQNISGLVIFQIFTAFLILYFINNTVPLYDELTSPRFFCFIIFGSFPFFIYFISTDLKMRKLYVYICMIILLIVPFIRIEQLTVKSELYSKEGLTKVDFLKPEECILKNVKGTIYLEPPVFSWQSMK